MEADRQSTELARLLHHAGPSGWDRILARILREEGPFLERHLARQFRLDSQDIDNIVGDCLWKAFHHRKRVSPERPLRAWLLTVARHAAIDLIKSRSTRLKHETATVQDGQDSRVPDPSRSGVDRETTASAKQLDLVEQVRAVLAQLTEAERTILFAWADKSGDQWTAGVSKRLGISPNTLRVKRSRLLERIRKELEEVERDVLGK